MLFKNCFSKFPPMPHESSHACISTSYVSQYHRSSSPASVNQPYIYFSIIDFFPTNRHILKDVKVKMPLQNKLKT
jgi:hypothetical protein